MPSPHTPSYDDKVPKMPLPAHKHDDKPTSTPEPDQADLAVNLIRDKLNNIYNDAPDAGKELTEIKGDHHRHSKHQKFIIELQKSGKSMVEIQTAWHNYYMKLPDSEKNQVWQEFYDANKHPGLVSQRVQPHYIADPEPTPEKVNEPTPHQNFVSVHEEPDPPKKTAAEIKDNILANVEKQVGNQWFARFHSLLFGLGVGVLVIIFLLFGFFNDRFIAPFVTPSRDVSAQSLIADPTGGAVGPNPLIIIPKINVEIPVIYSLQTTDENVIENSLQDGVVHYPTTAYPGQLGNGAIFGHSSNNILNPGKYKFAFVLLHDLEVGDTFTLDYQGKAYVYQIFQRQIVPPTDVSVLNNIPGHSATFTLITCDPPGTSINRLVVVGDQISPAPSLDTAGPNQNNAAKPAVLPSNSPSLWSRLTSWL